MNRPGDWNCTVSGSEFWPLDPRPDEIHIEDIAHALSNVCRFGGHTIEFYSVAQHSVLVADLLKEFSFSRIGILTGLMHDAPEFIIGDMTRPLKRCEPMGPMFCEIENRIYSVIAEKFGLIDPLPYYVKNADNTLLVTEARDLMPHLYLKDWSAPSAKPLPERIKPWSPAYARDQFLDRYHRYRGIEGF